MARATASEREKVKARLAANERYEQQRLVRIMNTFGVPCRPITLPKLSFLEPKEWERDDG